MQLRNEKTQEGRKGVSARKSHSPQTNFQLEGLWLHMARGAWIAFVLVELIVIIFTLFASRGYSLTICAWTDDTSCAITPATVQALHHLGIALSSYATYKLVLVLFQSLIFLGIGGFIFWRKSSEPHCLAASFFFVTAGLWPFFTMRTYPPAVVSGYIYGLCIYTAFGYFLVAFPDGRFVPRWSWLLVVLLLVQTMLFEIPGPLNILSWPFPLFIAELLRHIPDLSPQCWHCHPALPVMGYRCPHSSHARLYDPDRAPDSGLRWPRVRLRDPVA